MIRLGLLISLLIPTWALAQTEVQLMHEAKCTDLLGESSTFEASGVTLKDNQLYVVFDNDDRIARFNRALSKGELLGPKNVSADFEGITWDPKRERFYVMIEARFTGRSMQPVMLELDAELQILTHHDIPFDLDRPNKGCEGVAWFEHEKTSHVILLLEGKEDQNLGLALVMKFAEGKLEPVARLTLTPMATFKDHAGIAYHDGQLAVVSQSSSKLWVGTLNTVQWTVDEGQIYQFPRQDGKVVYGNIEGVVWLDEQTLVCVSDQPKEGRDEHQAKGESIHLFKIPD